MPDSHQTNEGLRRLESVIRGAGGYVHPTEDLRPRTLESARERSSISRGKRHVLLMAAALLFAVAMSMLHPYLYPASDAIAGKSTSAAELHRQAGEKATAFPGATGWGLYEAFVQLRQSQSERFRNAD